MTRTHARTHSLTHTFLAPSALYAQSHIETSKPGVGMDTMDCVIRAHSKLLDQRAFHLRFVSSTWYHFLHSCSKETGSLKKMLERAASLSRKRRKETRGIASAESQRTRAIRGDMRDYTKSLADLHHLIRQCKQTQIQASRTKSGVAPGNTVCLSSVGACNTLVGQV